MSIATAQTPIQLNWDSHGDVVVLARDRERFLLTMQQAAEACARGRQQLVWKEEFDQLLKRVHGWAADRGAMVSSVYVGFLEGQVTFFVVPRGERMDFALSDEIATLEIELYQDFCNCKGEVRQIPGHTLEALASFVDLEQAILVYGDPPAAPEAMGA